MLAPRGGDGSEFSLDVSSGQSLETLGKRFLMPTTENRQGYKHLSRPQGMATKKYLRHFVADPALQPAIPSFQRLSVRLGALDCLSLTPILPR